MTCLCTNDEHGHTDPCDKHLFPTVFALVGPSGSGKSTIIHRVINKLPTVKILKSLTTRAPRGNDPKDPMFYEFVNDSVFNFFKSTGQMLQAVTYAGEQYGVKLDALTQRQLGESIRPGSTAGPNRARQGSDSVSLIYSVTEEGLAQLKARNDLNVVGIRLVTFGTPNRELSRINEDLHRFDDTHIDHTIYSQYGKEGLVKATDRLSEIINLWG